MAASWAGPGRDAVRCRADGRGGTRADSTFQEGGSSRGVLMVPSWCAYRSAQSAGRTNTDRRRRAAHGVAPEQVVHQVARCPGERGRERVQVLVGGQDVGAMDERQLYAARRRMGMLFQFGALFTDLSVFDNVAFPLREHTNLPEALGID